MSARRVALVLVWMAAGCSAREPVVGPPAGGDAAAPAPARWWEGAWALDPDRLDEDAAFRALPAAERSLAHALVEGVGADYRLAIGRERIARRLAGQIREVGYLVAEPTAERVMLRLDDGRVMTLERAGPDGLRIFLEAGRPALPLVRTPGEATNAPERGR